MAEEATQDDACPVCKLPTSLLKFINTQLVRMFGFVECTRCGAVYVPKSIMKQKEAIARTGLLPNVEGGTPSGLIVE